MKVASNTTPIISLSSIQRLELLKLLFKQVYIPKAVYHEIKTKKLFGYKEIDADWVKVLEIKGRKYLGFLLNDLDAGEAEAIVLAKEIEADILLIDERIGYDIAKSQNIFAIGTLTVLLMAKQKGLIQRVKPLLNEMIQKGRWYSEKTCKVFLKKIEEKNIQAIGLELNSQAIEVGLKAGLKIEKKSIEDFASEHQSEFDLVCSFQVLEHLSDTKKIIDSSLKILKPGGKLIISVPNNDSFIKLDQKNILNMPPHHLGLWDKESLSNLPKFFDLKLEKIYIEPLQKYHFKYYSYIKFGQVLVKKFGFTGKIINNLLYFAYQMISVVNVPFLGI